MLVIVHALFKRFSLRFKQDLNYFFPEDLLQMVLSHLFLEVYLLAVNPL